MITFRKYLLYLIDPLQTAAGTISKREGFIIEGEHEDIRFWGDVAPLPGFSVENHEDVRQCFENELSVIQSFFLEEESPDLLDELCRRTNMPPSLRFGLSSALADFNAKRCDLPLSVYLDKEALHKVKVSTIIPSANLDASITEAGRLWEEGFRTFKLKVGMDLDIELEILNQIRKKFPDANLRIDANGSLDTDEAIAFLNLLEHLDLEFCEQPVPAENLSALAEVKYRTSVPIAADESARSLDHVRNIIDQNAADVLILKPMLIGSINEFQNITSLAYETGLDAVVTNCFESGIGRLMTAHLAASLPDQSYAHGLATGNLLKTDLLDDALCIRSSEYILPNIKGLGLEPVFEY